MLNIRLLPVRCQYKCLHNPANNLKEGYLLGERAQIKGLCPTEVDHHNFLRQTHNEGNKLKKCAHCSEHG